MSKGYSRAAFVTAFGNFVPPIAAFVTAPILAHGLGVVGRGEVSAAQAPLLLFTAVAALGLPDAATYFVARSPRLLGVLVRRAALMMVLLGAAAMAATVLLAGILSGGDQTIASLISVSAIALVPSLILSLVRGAAIGTQAWTLVAFERSTSSVVRLIAIAGLFSSDHLTVLNTVLINAWYPMVGGLVYLWMFTKRFQRTLGDVTADPTTVTIGRLAGYGTGVWMGSLAGVLLARVDQVLIVPLAGAYALGIYAVAVSVAELPLLINNTIREVMFSADARSNDNARLTYAARISGFVCLCVAIAIGATMWWWMPVLFGSDFNPSVVVAYVLLLSVIVGPPGSVAGAGLSARGKPVLRSTSIAVALVINVGLVIMLVPWMGAMGAAVATLGGNLVSSNLNIWFAHRVLRIPASEFYRLRLSDLRKFYQSMTAVARRGTA
jgi:O-antigen/teichoic acid export membrane protein